MQLLKPPGATTITQRRIRLESVFTAEVNRDVVYNCFIKNGAVNKIDRFSGGFEKCSQALKIGYPRIPLCDTFCLSRGRNVW